MVGAFAFVNHAGNVGSSSWKGVPGIRAMGGLYTIRKEHLANPILDDGFCEKNDDVETLFGG